MRDPGDSEEQSETQTQAEAELQQQVAPGGRRGLGKAGTLGQF